MILSKRQGRLVWISMLVLSLFIAAAVEVRGEQTVTNAAGMEFIYIEAGTFLMGSPEDEPLRSDSEVLHERTIKAPFYMQTTPVTIGQWHDIMGKRWFFARRGDEDAPVTRVSWHEAQSFIKRLNQMGDGTYRLPAEAEWEYAARAGTTTAYSWGDDIDCSLAIYANNEAKADQCVPYVKSIGLEPNAPAPVKTYAPNPWGLFDMHGNVWEWIEDCFRSYIEPEDKTLFDCSRRVRRGGSWFGHGYQVRSANRAYAHPAVKFQTTGFRVVKEVR